MRTVVSRGLGEASIEDLSLRSVGSGDVRVEISASSICHSDLAVLNGRLGGRFPIALGHEGTGTIVEAGPSTRLTVGDRVVFSAVPSCGSCWFCARGCFHLCERSASLLPAPYRDGGEEVRGFAGLGTFSSEVVVSERSVVRVDTDLPAAQLSVIGCAVLTGAGAVFNIADVGAGTSLLVVGAGGIGLAAIQAGRALGAHPIAAIDPSDAARAAALRAGATIACDPGDTQLLLAVTDSRGFDVAIDCVSTGATLDVTWPLTRRGGEIVLVGVTASSEQFPFAPIDVVLSGRRLTGCVYGGSSIHRDIPRYVRLAEAGKLDLAALIGRTVSLQDVPELLLHGPIGPGRTIVR